MLGVLGFLVKRWIEQRARRSVEGTVYGLTTRRALIVNTYPALVVEALPIDAISDLTVSDVRGDVGDLCLRTAQRPTPLVFRGLAEPERARTQLLRVIRDPLAAEQEVAAAEAYAMQMQRLMVRPM